MTIQFYDAAEYGEVGKERVPYHTWHPSGYGERLSNRLEINITEDCNLKCVHCDRSCRQAPSKDYMSVEQMRRFVDDSISRGFFWWILKFAGGEPTLHPHLFEMFRELKRYWDASPTTRIWLNTNGLADNTKNIISRVRSWGWVHVNDSGKTTPNVTHHDAYNMAPADFGLVAPPCHRPWDCGMGLSRYGFYPCGAGAGIDRVFGFDVGIKDMSGLTHGAVLRQLLILCPLCGYSPTKIKEYNVSEEKMSESWVRAYERYREAPPKLALAYGGDR